MTGKALAAVGALVTFLMVVLLAIGTTSSALFVVYLVLLFAGAGAAALGLKQEKAATFEKLEQEMRSER